LFHKIFEGYLRLSTIAKALWVTKRRTAHSVVEYQRESRRKGTSPGESRDTLTEGRGVGKDAIFRHDPSRVSELWTPRELESRRKEFRHKEMELSSGCALQNR